MVDLAHGMEARNYGIKETSTIKSLGESLKTLLPLIAIAGALAIYIWTYSETIHIGYQAQQLNKLKEEALKAQQQLIIEEQTLKSPEWLETTVRRDLGMVPIKAAQVLIAPALDQYAGSTDTLALVHSSGAANTSAVN
jgi:hypothetical protein